MATKPTVLQQVKNQQPAVFGEMQKLSKRFGADVFRICGQRFFKKQLDENRLREEIAKRERELQKLKGKVEG